MVLFSVLLLAFAVSVDGFGVGLAYGLGKMKLPPLSLVLLGLASGTAVLLSMTVGSLISLLFSPEFTARIGGGILVVFGALMLVQQLSKRNRAGGLLGLLDEPARADFDRSGTISVREGVVLGLALALDAFGAGFGAAMAGFPPIWTAVAVAGAKILLVGGGFALGESIAAAKWVERLQVLPGLIICGLGVVKFILV
ncbi:MAG: sporulation membrane protein YtaF [Firmicutes bacterium]|nr:sporulation membrane protein YtaF [Bacillota bacterium]